jgi:hypothetical protein
MANDPQYPPHVVIRLGFSTMHAGSKHVCRDTSYLEYNVMALEGSDHPYKTNGRP